LLRRNKGPSAEAVAARLDAEKALARQHTKLPEAERVRAALADHNEGNHYAAFLFERMLGSA